MKKLLRLLFTAAVMIPVICCFAGIPDLSLSGYPEKKWDDISGLVLHDMEWVDDSAVIATGPDPYAEIRDVDMRIRSVSVYSPSIRRKVPEVPGTVQIYYDLGDDYFEVYSVQVKLKEGCTRAVFHENGIIRNLRFDFFSEKGSAIRIDRIVLNEPSGIQGPVMLMPAVLMAAAALAAAWFGSGIRWLVFLAGDAALLLAGGIPARETGQPQALISSGIFGSLFLVLLAVAIFMKEGPAKERVFAVLLVATAAAFYFSWSVMTPYGEGPDEAMHYDVVDFIHTYGALPRGDDPRIRNDIWGFSYAFSPILPFILGAGIDAVIKLFTKDFFTLVMGARMISILSGALCVFLVFRIGCHLFPGEKARYVFPVCVGFFPELAFLFTYINSDAFAIMTTALIVLFWVRGISSDWAIRDQIGLAAGISLCALTYYNCYGFILLSVPVFLFSLIAAGKDRRFTAVSTGRIIVLVFLMCGWWFIRNGILYNGDILGRRTLNATEELYALPEYRPSNIRTPQKDGVSVFYMVFRMGWLKSTYESFIAMFSHYRLPGRVLIFRIFKRYFALAAAGVTILFFRWIGKWRRLRSEKDLSTSVTASERAAFGKNAVLHINLAFAACIPVGLALYYSYASDYQPQGRYIMPCIIPLMYFCVLGFREAGRTVRELAGRIRCLRNLVCGCCGGFVLLQAIFHLACCLNVFYDTVWPYYH